MSEMVERVARAICKAVGYDADEPARKHGALNDLPMWRTYERDARAAIASMRTPTRAMEIAGSNFEAPTLVWSAMIDEALR